MKEEIEKKIINAWICQADGNKISPVFGDVIISNGKIAEIRERNFEAFWSEPVHNSENVLNAVGRVLTVPMINFHDHFYSRLAKGLPLFGPMENFHNILENLWWKLDRALDLEMVEACAQMGAMESIRNGATYFFDHHASPDATAGSLNIIRDVLAQFGLRGVLCFETSDRNGSELAAAGLRENERFLREAMADDFKGMVGLHASFTLTDETLQRAAEIVRTCDVGIHIHLCEAGVDPELSSQRYGAFPTQRLAHFNLLNDRSILSHGVFLSDADYSLIARYGAALVYNPDSNMNNAVGLPQFARVPAGIPILTGTDGMHANVARSIKQLYLLLRHSGLDFEGSFQRIQTSHFDQLAFVRKYFPDFPSLKINDRADMILWDYVPPTPYSADNFWSHFLFGMLERNIHSVVQRGAFLLKNFQLVGVDEAAIMENIFRQGKRLYNKV
ncbi:MAG: amidohydrolase family protein [Candidatus Zhuqueibacterota bacterium]